MAMQHPIMGYENLHRHSSFSLLDGFAFVSEYAEYQPTIDQKFLCITDHGVMGAIPEQVAECDKHNLFPLFGCELYVNNLQPKTDAREESKNFRSSLDEDQKKLFDKSNHLLAIAYTDEGYCNLVRMTSWAWIHGFYKRPRVNHEVLQRYKEGILFTSACASSEIARAFFDGGDDAGFQMLEKYLAMFGENFRLEMMMLDFKLQKPLDGFLVRAHAKYGIPLLMSTDCHYCRKEHSHNQQLMLMQKNRHTLAEIETLIANGDTEDIFALQDKNLFLKSEREMDEMWEAEYSDIIDYELYKQAKAETVRMAEKAKGVQINRELKLPKFPDADQRLWAEIMAGFNLRRCPKSAAYIRRIREEYELIQEKDFSSYFLIQKMMTDEARRASPEILGYGDGSEAVGPGRGSIGGSLVAYCLRLHDVDPILHDLRFSRFLSPSRGGKQMRIRHTIEPLPHSEIKLAS